MPPKVPFARPDMTDARARGPCCEACQSCRRSVRSAPMTAAASLTTSRSPGSAVSRRDGSCFWRTPSSSSTRASSSASSADLGDRLWRSTKALSPAGRRQGGGQGLAAARWRVGSQSAPSRRRHSSTAQRGRVGWLLGRDFGRVSAASSPARGTWRGYSMIAALALLPVIGWLWLRERWLWAGVGVRAPARVQAQPCARRARGSAHGARHRAARRGACAMLACARQPERQQPRPRSPRSWPCAASSVRYPRDAARQRDLREPHLVPRRRHPRLVRR